MKSQILYRIFNIIFIIMVFVFTFQAFNSNLNTQLIEKYKSADTLFYDSSIANSNVYVDNNDTPNSSGFYSASDYAKRAAYFYTRYNVISLQSNDITITNDYKGKLVFSELLSVKEINDVDIQNYDMSPFQVNNKGKTLYPVIICSDLKESYPIGSTFFSFDYSNSNVKKSFAYIVIGYANTVINGEKTSTYSVDYYKENAMAIINFNDYEETEDYLGIMSNYLLSSKSEEFHKLLSKWYLSDKKINFSAEEVSGEDIISKFVDFKIQNAQNVLGSVSNYSDVNYNKDDYIIGRTPKIYNEIVLNISSKNALSKEDVQELSDYLATQETVSLKLFNSYDAYYIYNYQLEQNFTVVGFRVSQTSNYDIYFDDSLFDIIKTKIDVTSYDNFENIEGIRLGNNEDIYYTIKDIIELEKNDYMNSKNTDGTLEQSVASVKFLLYFIYLTSVVVSVIFIVNYLKAKVEEREYSKYITSSKILFDFIPLIFIILLSYIFTKILNAKEIYTLNMPSFYKSTIVLLVIYSIFELVKLAIINSVESNTTKK